MHLAYGALWEWAHETQPPERERLFVLRVDIANTHCSRPETEPGCRRTGLEPSGTPEGGGSERTALRKTLSLATVKTWQLSGAFTGCRLRESGTECRALQGNAELQDRSEGVVSM